MNGTVVRTSGGARRGWRMRQWPNDPSIAHLVFVDHLATPTADDLRAAIDHARRRGARAVRTSALFPRATEVVLAHGFRAIDELALLSRSLPAEVASSLAPEGATIGAASDPRIRPLRRRHHPRAAHLDRAAFGPMWGNDVASLRDVCRATPVHRARIVMHARDVVGLAVSGAAGEHGYLQRLAVADAHRRRGIARALVTDALGWMSSRGLRACLVNTGVANAPALALYASLGFVFNDDHLTIAEYRIAAAGSTATPVEPADDRHDRR